MNTPLLDRLWVDQPYSYLRAAMAVLIGTLLLTLAAKIQVPFYPVPMTLQTLAILIICTTLGMRLGIITVLLYVTEGALGWPVFAGGGGLAYMAGPTGGYILGFVVAAWVLGYGVQRGWDRSFLPCLALMFGAVALIYGLGYLWLTSFIGYEKAFTLGILPFVLGDLLKMLLAALSLKILHSF